MSPQLHEHVRAALPDEDAVHAALSDLPDGAWVEAARELFAGLPDFDVLLTPEGEGGAFGHTLALLGGANFAVARRGMIEAPQVRGERWGVEQHLLAGNRTALIATPVLTDGVPELELAALARGAGLAVVGAASALEFTSQAARSRLDMLGAKVYALAQLAHTPRGLQFERRGAGGNLLVPMP